MTTIAPSPDFSSAGRAASQPNTVPMMSMSRLRRHDSSSMPMARALTLAMKMSRPPSALTVSSIHERSALVSATSTAPPLALTPFWWSVATVSSTWPLVRAQSATAQPSSASVSTMARPMPRVPPVTIAFLPSSFRSTSLLPSAALPLRLALLGESLGAPDAVRAFGEPLDRGKRALRLIGFGRVGEGQPAIDRLLRGADRHRRQLQDLRRPALRRGERLPLRHHFVDEAERLPLARADATAGQDHAHGLLQRDLPRQAVQPAGQRGKADTRLGQGEDGILGGDDEVAGERDLEAAAHGDALHRGDHRLHQIEPAGEAGEARGRMPGLVSGGLVFQVVAGGEGLVAGAGDDGDPEIRIGGEAVPHLVELEMRRPVQRVHHLRPVDGDARPRAPRGPGHGLVPG